MTQITISPHAGDFALTIHDASPAGTAAPVPRARFVMSACESPVCDCRELGFHEVAEPAADGARSLRAFWLDPFARSVA
ncbi:MAG: hypothetical protein IPM29_01530 [Planctomycetes bacterium]|nr:hypothetical protein [Planctomycetota bacterium]